MTAVRNKGTPWRRPNGEVVPVNGIFEPTTSEYASFTRRHQVGTRFQVLEDPGVAVAAADAPARTETAAAGITIVQTSPVIVVEAWVGKLPPQDYLDRYPNGKKAALARALVAKRST